MCSEYRIHNADVHLKEDCDVDDLVDVIEGSRVYIPCIYVLNKIDQVRQACIDTSSVRCVLCCRPSCNTFCPTLPLPCPALLWPAMQHFHRKAGNTVRGAWLLHLAKGAAVVGCWFNHCAPAACNMWVRSACWHRDCYLTGVLRTVNKS